jgi:hypothetical protein
VFCDPETCTCSLAGIKCQVRIGSLGIWKDCCVPPQKEALMLCIIRYFFTWRKKKILARKDT